MFHIQKDDQQLAFMVERGEVRFGDGSRMLFWIDRNIGALQRGRQEYIPLSSIEGFSVGDDGRSLLCDFGKKTMTLYQGNAKDAERLREAASVLMDYCGLST